MEQSGAEKRSFRRGGEERSGGEEWRNGGVERSGAEWSGVVAMLVCVCSSPFCIGNATSRMRFDC